MKRDFNSAFPEQKMEPEVNLLFEPERSESESDSDSDKDPSAPKGIWSCEDPTGCLPYEKLDLENWTNSELFQLGCEGLAVYNAAHNTNYQIKYIMRTVEIARTVNDPKEDARYVITLGVEDDKTGNMAGDFHYNWVGEIPSLGDQNTNEGIGPMKRCTKGAYSNLAESKSDSVDDEKDSSSSAAAAAAAATPSPPPPSSCKT